MDSLQTLRKQVEKETGQDLSWDTAVQLRVIQELTEVSSQVAQLSKVLAEILSEARLPTVPEGNLDARSSSKASPASTSSPERNGGVTDGVSEPGRRGRPRKGGGNSVAP